MPPFFILPLFLLLSRRCGARLVNVTIDDKFGDERTGAVPTYIPEGQWTGAGQAGAYRSTLHQRINDLPGNISIAFSGVRIYTFFAYWPASQVDLVFFLDGALTPTKRFTKPPYTGSDPLYWEFLMAFQSDTLDPGNHHLLVSSPAGRTRHWPSTTPFTLWTNQIQIRRLARARPRQAGAQPAVTTIRSAQSQRLHQSLATQTQGPHRRRRTRRAPLSRRSPADLRRQSGPSQAPSLAPCSRSFSLSSSSAGGAEGGRDGWMRRSRTAPG